MSKKGKQIFRNYERKIPSCKLYQRTHRYAREFRSNLSIVVLVVFKQRSQNGKYSSRQRQSCVRTLRSRTAISKSCERNWLLSKPLAILCQCQQVSTIRFRFGSLFLYSIHWLLARVKLITWWAKYSNRLLTSLNGYIEWFLWQVPSFNCYASKTARLKTPITFLTFDNLIIFIAHIC